MGYTLLSMFLYGAILGYVNTAQQVLVGIYNLGNLFPLAFAATAILQSMAGFTNSRFVQKLGMRYIIHAAILIFTGTAGLLWALSLWGSVNFWVYTFLFGILMLSVNWVIINATALAMESMGKVAGTASGVFGTFQALGGAIIGYLINQIYDNTITPIAASITLLGIAGLLCILFAEKGKLFGKSTTAP